MKLILIRHGETHENVAGIIQGQGPGRLTDIGKEQAKKVGLRLKNEKIDVAYVSDLERTCNTAKEILHYNQNNQKIPVVYTKELRERNFGIYEGLPREEWRELLEKNKEQYTGTITGGESRLEVTKRIVAFCDKLLKKHKQETVLIVSHGGPLTLLYLHLFEKSQEEYKNYHPSNAAVTILEISDDKKHTVYILNCVKHLE